MNSSASKNPPGRAKRPDFRSPQPPPAATTSKTSSWWKPWTWNISLWSIVVVLFVCTYACSHAADRPACTCPQIQCPDVSLSRAECYSPASFMTVETRSSNIRSISNTLAVELFHGAPLNGASRIDDRIHNIKMLGRVLETEARRCTEQFGRLQTMTVDAMTDACSKLCRPRRSWMRLWADWDRVGFVNASKIFLFLPDDNAAYDNAVLADFVATVGNATRAYHAYSSEYLPPNITIFDAKLNDTIREANNAWQMPLSKEKCDTIDKKSCNTFSYLQGKPQRDWMTGFMSTLVDKRELVGEVQTLVQKYLAALDRVDWKVGNRTAEEETGAEAKVRWMHRVGRQVRAGVEIGTATVDYSLKNE